jgi:hypothetical protein
MFKAVLFDKACWTQHLKLDAVTGLDPEGIKLRAAQGIHLTIATPYYTVIHQVICRFGCSRLLCNWVSLDCYEIRVRRAGVHVRHIFLDIGFGRKSLKIWLQVSGT